MGAKKFKTVDMTSEPTKKKKSYEEKKATRDQEVDALDASMIAMASGASDEAIAEVEIAEEVAPEAEVKEEGPRRGKKYTTARGVIDRSKVYGVAEAIDTLKKVHFAKFDESVELHLVLREITPSVEVAFPHTTGKVVRVAVLDDDIMAKLDKGVIEFDVLLATPAQMGKITKFARLLGPKGLMPNPKNRTLIADPAKRKAELEAGKVAIRGEKKAPLMHVLIGKISTDTDKLAENAQALVNAVGPTKVLKVSVCTTMSPALRVTV